MNKTMSRKDRRAIKSQASKLYGVKGEASVAIHNAYLALDAGNSKEAAAQVSPLLQTHPDNVHPWIILGKLALAERDGETARQFFQKALDIKPQNAISHHGIGTAFFLSKNPFDCTLVVLHAVERILA